MLSGLRNIFKDFLCLKWHIQLCLDDLNHEKKTNHYSNRYRLSSLRSSRNRSILIFYDKKEIDIYAVLPFIFLYSLVIL